MAKKRKPNDEPPRPAPERVSVGSARAEVVDVLAGAVFTLLISGRVPRPAPAVAAPPAPEAKS